MRAECPTIPLLARPFYFLRHGETESNAAGTLAGSIDVPLTERGHAQARAAAAALENCGITVIYSSALRRARDTADYIAGMLRLPVSIVPELAERHWGVLEGKSRELRVPGITPPGAETPEEFTARVFRGLAKIKPEDLPLIVSHSGVFRVLCRTLGIAEPAERVDNARPVRCIPPDAEQPRWRLEVR
jgi:2,3-bisphosphoglycerate-dependent phosphoglycerate mutase